METRPNLSSRIFGTFEITKIVRGVPKSFSRDTFQYLNQFFEVEEWRKTIDNEKITYLSYGMELCIYML